MLKYFIIVLFLLCACSVQYKLTYNTYLEQSQTKELYFKDDKFAFNFIPVSNGIFFSIENLTDKTAFLIWDKSYFIEPDGNSYKPINLDLLKVEEEIARKELNESVLPKGTSFSRFTAPNINVEVFKDYDITEINNYFYSGVNSDITVVSNKFFEVGNYWKTLIKPKPENKTFFDDVSNNQLDAELSDVRKFVLDNDKLGLGLAIRMDEKIYDYQFNFRLEAVKLYEISGNKSTLIKTATKENNWSWINVE